MTVSLLVLLAASGSSLPGTDPPPPGGGTGDVDGYTVNTPLTLHTPLSGATAVAQSRVTGGTFSKWNTLNRLGLVPTSLLSTEAEQTLTARGKSTYAVEFDFTGSTFDVEATGGWINVWADDQQVGSPVLLSGSQAVRVTLPSATARRIVVECGAETSLSGTDVKCTLSGIRHFAGVLSVPTVQRRRLFIVGDSWVEGASYDAAGVNAPAMRHMAWLAGRYAGADVYYNGRSGSGYKATQNFNGHYGYSTRVAQVVSAAPDDVLVFGSINDFQTADTTTNASAYYSTLAAQLPNANVVVVGRQSFNNSSNANGVDEDIQAGITGHPNVIGYVSPRAEAWITGTGHTLSGTGDAAIYHNGNNQQHLSDAGNLYYGRKLAQVLADLLPLAP